MFLRVQLIIDEFDVREIFSYSFIFLHKRRLKYSLFRKLSITNLLDRNKHIYFKIDGGAEYKGPLTEVI